MSVELSDEDAKLVTLARGAMGRAGTAHGAAVRDLDGRTYAGAPVALAALKLTGLQVAVATAVGSGAEGFEAAVVVGADGAADPGVDAAREVSAGVVVHLLDRSGTESTS
ncbi:cytidine deaminase [Tsukamurella sp. 8F]|uniref:cytidine deaminase n=1 Tax=unclassified Tsukamurella TaxID=2633480 RepID=UPI0023BA04D7|nr:MULTISPECIES: cytidine deaminase [unclassified Tsukamurella]MDF0530014.1 cytidine deaminase [Tsukamurella sp. 8J]MDF0587214.1 cytidine deaminase [Tsukamurella sp. 8F]